MGKTEQQEKQRAERLQELIDKENEYNKAINESDYSTLAKEYEKTHTLKQELIDSSLKLAEALEIEGAEALVESGNFDLLNQKLQESIAGHKELRESALEAQNASINKKNSTYQLFGRSLKQDLTQDLITGHNNDIREAVGIKGTAPNQQDINTFAFKSAREQNEITKETQELNKKAIELEKERTKAYLEGNTAEEKRLSTEYQKIQDEINKKEELLGRYEELDEKYNLDQVIENNKEIVASSLPDIIDEDA